MWVERAASPIAPEAVTGERLKGKTSTEGEEEQEEQEESEKKKLEEREERKRIDKRTPRRTVRELYPNVPITGPRISRSPEFICTLGCRARVCVCATVSRARTRRRTREAARAFLRTSRTDSIGRQSSHVIDSE